MTTQQLMSFEEAKDLLTEPNACLKLVTATRHLTLLPKYIGSFKAGIVAQLNSKLRFYSNQLEGVLVAYSNIQSLENHARIVDHYPHLHVHIQADFIIFQPSIGAVLKGIINKQGKDHIGVLVHNCFNGSLPKPKLPNGDILPSDKITLGQTVTFTVKKLYTLNGIVSFNGVMTEESMKKITSGIDTFDHDDVMDGIETSAEKSTASLDEVSVEPGKKKKKNKRKRKEVQ